MAVLHDPDCSFQIAPTDLMATVVFAPGIENRDDNAIQKMKKDEEISTVLALYPDNELGVVQPGADRTTAAPTLHRDPACLDP